MIFYSRQETGTRLSCKAGSIRLWTLTQLK